MHNKSQKLASEYSNDINLHFISQSIQEIQNQTDKLMDHFCNVTGREKDHFDLDYRLGKMLNLVNEIQDDSSKYFDNSDVETNGVIYDLKQVFEERNDLENKIKRMCDKLDIEYPSTFKR